MDRFRDKAGEAVEQGKDQVDERTGGRFREQTERMADAARQRLGGGETDETDETAESEQEDTEAQAEGTQDTEPLGVDQDEEDQELDETGRPVGDRPRSSWEEGGL